MKMLPENPETSEEFLKPLSPVEQITIAPDIVDAAPAPQDFAIEVREVSKWWPRKTERVAALHHVSLDVRRGSIHGVVGSSGAGKSTLLRCIAGLEKPDSGTILVEGENWAESSRSSLGNARRRMGVVFQQLHLLNSRTAAGNIELPLELAGMAKPERAARSRELLHWFGIEDKAQVYPTRLSGGQRQRVALARALATKPSILLADEPTSSLDYETRDTVLEILERIRRELGVTVLLITHDLTATRSICDSVSVLAHGRLVETGPPRQVYARPSSDEARRLLSSAFLEEI